MGRKFKIGDKIIGNKRASSEYAITVEGWVGVVTLTKEGSDDINRWHVGDDICVLGGDTNGIKRHFDVCSDYFDILFHKNPIISKMESL